MGHDWKTFCLLSFDEEENRSATKQTQATVECINVLSFYYQSNFYHVTLCFNYETEVRNMPHLHNQYTVSKTRNIHFVVASLMFPEDKTFVEFFHLNLKIKQKCNITHHVLSKTCFKTFVTCLLLTILSMRSPFP